MFLPPGLGQALARATSRRPPGKRRTYRPRIAPVRSSPFHGRQRVVRFEARSYGEAVAKILALDGEGARLMPLAGGTCSTAQARDMIARGGAQGLFPHSRAPEAALAGLYLYFSCWDDAHEVAQSVNTAEGSYWHAIVHRQEADAG